MELQMLLFFSFLFFFFFFFFFFLLSLLQVAVLKLYDSNTTSDEIDEIVFGNYEVRPASCRRKKDFFFAF